MTSYLAESGAQQGAHPPLLAKLRGSLLSLKQLENVHITARWVRSLFMDFLDRLEERGSRRPTDLLIEDDSRPQEIQDRSHPYARSRGQAMSTVAPVRLATVTTLGGDNNSDAYTDNQPFPGAWTHMSSSLVDDLFMLPSGGEGEFALEALPTGYGPFDTFPSPSTMQYQSMYFLADLGLTASDETQHGYGAIDHG